MKPYKKSLFTYLAWFSLFLFLFTKIAEAAYNDSMFYARYQIQTENGIITRSILEMIPVENDFRTENFINFKVTGRADEGGGIDMESEAIHNAISKVLISCGLTSINSKRHLTNSISGDIAILNYEGVVRYPIKIRNRDFKKEMNMYSLETEICFSPIAFPSQWSSLYIEYILKKMFQKVIAVFMN